MSALAIPEGSTVLVTGVNGYIGSQTAEQLLLAGYKVRGTVRDASRAQWVKELFDKKYGPGKFELFVVPHMNADGAFDEAVKGVSGVAHLASNVSFSPDPNVVIPETITGALNVLKSASREPSVKRVVYTSSAIATGFGEPNTPYNVPTDSWNDLASKLAWAPPPYEDDRKYLVYAASKTEAEKACWKFVEEEKPHFEFSTVLPCVTFGAPLHESLSAETLTWMRALLKGDYDILKKPGTAPYWFVDVADASRLHVAALINPTVKSERIFAYSETYNWSAILDILRKAYPERSWPENIPDEAKHLSTIEGRERSLELLKALGRDGYVSLEESVKAHAAQVL